MQYIYPFNFSNMATICSEPEYTLDGAPVLYKVTWSNLSYTSYSLQSYIKAISKRVIFHLLIIIIHNIALYRQ